MHQLILTVLALGLVASMSLVTLNYLPAWTTTSSTSHALVVEGVKTLVSAFELRAKANDGVPAAGADVSGIRIDGGLAPNFSGFYSFLPRAPEGYAWTYGYTSEAQLIADGYGGNAAGGLYWFCLHPLASGANEGAYRGMARAQQLFPETQYYLNTAGNAGCGRAINSEPSGFPTPASVTIFVRYIPETLSSPQKANKERCP